MDNYEVVSASGSLISLFTVIGVLFAIIALSILRVRSPKIVKGCWSTFGGFVASWGRQCRAFFSLLKLDARASGNGDESLYLQMPGAMPIPPSVIPASITKPASPEVPRVPLSPLPPLSKSDGHTDSGAPDFPTLCLMSANRGFQREAYIEHLLQEVRAVVGERRRLQTIVEDQQAKLVARNSSERPNRRLRKAACRDRRALAKATGKAEYWERLAGQDAEQMEEVKEARRRLEESHGHRRGLQEAVIQERLNATRLKRALDAKTSEDCWHRKLLRVEQQRSLELLKERDHAWMMYHNLFERSLYKAEVVQIKQEDWEAERTVLKGMARDANLNLDKALEQMENTLTELEKMNEKGMMRALEELEKREAAVEEREFTVSETIKIMQEREACLLQRYNDFCEQVADEKEALEQHMALMPAPADEPNITTTSEPADELSTAMIHVPDDEPTEAMTPTPAREPTTAEKLMALLDEPDTALPEDTPESFTTLLHREPTPVQNETALPDSQTSTTEAAMPLPDDVPEQSFNTLLDGQDDIHLPDCDPTPTQDAMPFTTQLDGEPIPAQYEIVLPDADPTPTQDAVPLPEVVPDQSFTALIDDQYEIHLPDGGLDPTPDEMDLPDDVREMSFMALLDDAMNAELEALIGVPLDSFDTNLDEVNTGEPTSFTTYLPPPESMEDSKEDSISSSPPQSEPDDDPNAAELRRQLLAEQAASERRQDDALQASVSHQQDDGEDVAMANALIPIILDPSSNHEPGLEFTDTHLRNRRKLLMRRRRRFLR